MQSISSQVMEALDNRPLSVRLKGLQEKISRKRHSKLLAGLRIMSPARLLLPHVICEKKLSFGYVHWSWSWA
ncbi:hypothetical protein QL285_070118 [Trifolium repens]|nr:hypothetical protein QL285_070118 [Trifolium repens]